MVMKVKQVLAAVGIVCVVQLGILVVSAEARVVEIQYDFTKVGGERLVVLVHEKTEEDRAQGEVRRIAGLEAYGFVLRSTDRVVLVARWSGDGTADVEYGVVEAEGGVEAVETLKKLLDVGVSGGEAVGEALDTGPARSQLWPVGEDLSAGGRLTATYTIANDGGTVTDGSGVLVFRVKEERPGFTISQGIVVTNASEPEVAIIKTSELVSFDKDGTPQRAYRQMILLRGVGNDLKPIQSMVTFFNFRLWRAFYISGGLQLNQKLFEEPILGVTWRHEVGDIGVNMTVGCLFSQEIGIVGSSGFAAGDKIDPTQGLTVDDIPTEVFRERRLAVGFSFDF